MITKIAVFSFCSLLGISSFSYATQTEKEEEKKVQPSTYKPDGKEQQTGQNNIRFRDIEFDNKAGAGDNKKNKNKNKGGGGSKKDDQ